MPDTSALHCKQNKNVIQRCSLLSWQIIKSWDNYFIKTFNLLISFIANYVSLTTGVFYVLLDYVA